MAEIISFSKNFAIDCLLLSSCSRIFLYCCLRVHKHTLFQALNLKIFRRYIAEILPIRRKTPYNQSINLKMYLASKSLSPKGLVILSARFSATTVNFLKPLSIAKPRPSDLYLIANGFPYTCIYGQVVYLQLVSSNGKHMNIICTFTHKICKLKMFNTLKRKCKLRK